MYAQGPPSQHSGGNGIAAAMTADNARHQPGTALAASRSPTPPARHGGRSSRRKHRRRSRSRSDASSRSRSPAAAAAPPAAARRTGSSGKRRRSSFSRSPISSRTGSRSRSAQRGRRARKRGRRSWSSSRSSRSRRRSLSRSSSRSFSRSPSISDRRSKRRTRRRYRSRTRSYSRSRSRSWSPRGGRDGRYRDERRWNRGPPPPHPRFFHGGAGPRPQHFHGRPYGGGMPPFMHGGPPPPHRGAGGPPFGGYGGGEPFRERAYETRKIHVKKSLATGRDKLTELFSPFGEVTDVFIPGAGAEKKFAFIEFKEGASAKAAIEAMHGKMVDGCNLDVAMAKVRRTVPKRFKGGGFQGGDGGFHGGDGGEPGGGGGRAPCRDFGRGECSRGESCRYAHNM